MIFANILKADQLRRQKARQQEQEAAVKRDAKAFQRGLDQRSPDPPLNIPADIMDHILRDASREFSHMIACAVHAKAGPQVAHYATEAARVVSDDYMRSFHPEAMKSFIRYDPPKDEWLLGLEIPQLNWRKRISRMEAEMCRR